MQPGAYFLGTSFKLIGFEYCATPLDFQWLSMLTGAMNLLDLTVNQLKRAAAIKEQIEDLNKDLRSILGGSANPGAASKKKPTTSASGKKNIAAKPATRSAKPAVKKKTMSPAVRAKLSAKLKAYWAAKRAGKK